MVEYQGHVTTTQNTLRVLAELTGGFAVVNRNNFADALKRIDAETSNYYLLGYYASPAGPSRKARKLEVRVKRPNAVVRSRTVVR